MIPVTVTNGELTQQEMRMILDNATRYKGCSSITVSIDGDNLDIYYYTNPKPFERIRRITGYLVGTLDRFNDAKRSEVEERVKHGYINS